jgi:hypothetical protein
MRFSVPTEIRLATRLAGPSPRDQAPSIQLLRMEDHLTKSKRRPRLWNPTF